MFRYIIRKIRVLGNILKKHAGTARQNQKSAEKFENIPKSIDKIIKVLGAMFFNCSNFVYRKIELPNKTKFLVTYIDGFIDYQRLDLGIIKPLLDNLSNIDNKLDYKFNIEYLKNKLILPSDLIEIENMTDVSKYLFAGFSILFLDNEKKALAVLVKGYNKRDTVKTELENTVRGPKESFIENATVNLTLITKIVSNPQLKSEIFVLGKRTNTKVYLCYLEGVAKENIINIAKQRLAKINVDAILDANYVREYVNDNPYTAFPLTGAHERPDIVAAQLLEGRIAIICDGSPMVITVPYLFIESIQNSEDYFNKPIFASVIRIIRLIALVITLLLPALYICVLNFHHEVIPFELIVTASAGQENIPLSSLFEVLIMLSAFELLREASIRMPKGVGQTISIVGALVLGEAAVKAGFVSNLVVIVIALTAICSFANSSLLDTVSILRIFFVIISNLLGFVGVMFLIVLMSIHMCSLTSFTVPYMSPLAPWNSEGMKDALFRFPFKSMKARPKGIAKDKIRRGS